MEEALVDTRPSLANEEVKVRCRTQNGQQQDPNTGQYGAEGPVALDRAQLGVGARMVTFRGQNFQINKPANWQTATGSDGGAALLLLEDRERSEWSMGR